MAMTYLILSVISIALTIFITRLVFEIPKFSKATDEVTKANHETIELLRKQNELLTLMLHASFENKKIGLVNKYTAGVKVIDIAEVGQYDLSVYDIQVVSK